MELYLDLEDTWNINFDRRWNALDDRNLNLDRSPPSSQLHCLLLFEDGVYIYTLLLAPTQATYGQFRRLGIFHISPTDLGLEGCSQLPHIKNE